MATDAMKSPILSIEFYKALDDSRTSAYMCYKAQYPLDESDHEILLHLSVTLVDTDKQGFFELDMFGTWLNVV